MHFCGCSLKFYLDSLLICKIRYLAYISSKANNMTLTLEYVLKYWDRWLSMTNHSRYWYWDHLLSMTNHSRYWLNNTWDEDQQFDLGLCSMAWNLLGIIHLSGATSKLNLVTISKIDYIYRINNAWIKTSSLTLT